jgi:putative ABC transport system permease protein
MEFMRIALRSLARRKARTALGAGGVALAVALLLSLQGFNAGYEESLNRNVDRLGYHVLVTAKGCPYEAATAMLKGGTSLRYIRATVADDIVADPRVESVSRQLIRPLFDPENETSSFYMGVEDAFKRTGLVFAEGGWFTGPSEAEAIIGWEVAEFEQRHVGDELIVPDPSLPFEQRVLKVVGILERIGNQTDGTVHVPLEWMQGTFDLDGKLTGVGVVLTDDALIDVDRYENDLNEDPALGEAQVIGLKAARNAIVGLLENARALTLAISLVALVVALLGILNTVLMSVFERTPQIGTMKAIGAEDSDVFRIILGETFLISLFGALMGVAVALLGSDAVASLVREMLPFAPSGDLVQIHAGPAAAVVAGVVGIGVVAGIFPAWRAARTDPITAIRAGE